MHSRGSQLDPIQALAAGLTQGTGGTYDVDLRTRDGVHQLAEIVDLLFVKRIVGADLRESLSVHAPAAIMFLLSEPSKQYAKLACECFASVYPRLFLHVCKDWSAASHQLWQVVTAVKQQIAGLLDGLAQGASIGAAKACQRVILVQAKSDADPRLAQRTEPTIAMLPLHHPFMRVAELETEASQLFTKLITLLFTAAHPNTVMAVVHVLTKLARARPQLGKVVLEAYVSWTPAALGCAHVNLRSVENTMRLAMLHFLHHGIPEPHASQLQQALEAQKRRMDAAARTFYMAQHDSRKRDASQATEPSAKRTRAAMPKGLSAADLARLPVNRVVDAIIVGLQSVPETRLRAAIDAYVQGTEGASSAPVDPLKMDVGDDELAPLAEKNTGEEEESVAPLASLEHFVLPSPVPLEQREAHTLIIDSVSRICEQGSALAPRHEKISEAHAALWIKLLVRLATRGLDTTTHATFSQETPPALMEQAQKVRQLLCDFIAHDFAQRLSIAEQWLVEEWACDRLRHKHGFSGSYYTQWLHTLLDTQLHAPIDEPSLRAFFAALPELDDALLAKLDALCVDKASLHEGFALLSTIGAQRPPLRVAVCEKVLHLTRHHDRLVRGKAILTARTWVVQRGPLTDMVLDYAKDSLAQLKEIHEPRADHAEGADHTDENPAQDEATAALDGAPADTVAPTESLDQDVLRLMELSLVLSVKQPSIFAEDVAVYPHVAPAVQAAMNKHIAPVARAVGPNSAALLDVLRNAPPGAETLVDTAVGILVEKGHTKALASLVHALVESRGLSIEYLLPLVPYLDTAQIVEILPRAVALLRDPTDENKAKIRSLFRMLIAPALDGRDSLASAALSPVELMVLLHTHEQAIGLKAAVTATQLCFAMDDLFRADIMTAALNRLVEEPTLPVLFMRTTIMSIKTFRSLTNYVATSVLNKLVAKQIWNEPRLWDGFALCASLTAPTSFGALLQLPHTQLRDLMSKQPSMREPLRDYLIYKAGGPTHHAPLLEMLDQIA
ncbi:hypothetical protein MVES1_002381 [Malassezia vespertilionis]|uniref:Symplekin n=1 Tax=Malassezia vespertilionis TaxID=2020962 RepID=A0A2N1JBK6_9BASI|nr:uncharacterized protein MVES1_002381 [Malassezia vespertilionis]PKI83902.1 hypothetical protein MVES_002248 [Malassezia vespertilionis]WFD07025.1 hypothetical protein MVES1_002381 [Malassezia vespertilionis]